MELEFNRSTISYLEPVLREVQNQEQTQEIRLSDGMPDIGSILTARGQVILRSKEWRGDSIGFSGGVMVWVLYAPEDGSEPRTMESWIPFQMKWDLENGHRDGRICIRCLLRSVDARSVSARKILVRCNVAALGEGFSPDREEIGIPGEVPEDVQLLTATYPVRLPREAGEKTFQMDEELTLSGPMPDKLVSYTMEPKAADVKVMSNKVVFRGNGNLHVLYASEDGEFHSWDFEVPFSQFADLEGEYSSDARADVHMGITSLELEKEEGHLRLKCGMLGQYLVNDRQMLELVEDAYSPRREVTLERENLELPVILEQRTERVPATQTIHQDAKSIVDVTFQPDFPRQRRSGDEIELEMPGQFQVLYYGNEGNLQAGTARWDGSWQMRSDEAGQVLSTVMPGDQPRGTIGDGSIEMRGETELGLTTMTRSGIPAVMGLELGELREKDPARPSVILRRAGESRLWDIAKSTGSTVAAIKQVNGLESEPTMNQILLIPVS